MKLNPDSLYGKNKCKKDTWEVKIEKNINRLLTQLARALLGNNWPLAVAVRTERSDKSKKCKLPRVRKNKFIDVKSS